MVGDPDAAFSGAAKIIEAEYEIPFQGHTAFAGAHATADPSNGQMTIYSNDMKSYGMRNGVAQFLGMPRDKVRVVWMQGPQGFGRTAAEDAGCEAAWIASQIGRPVRMQWMREEETAWDTKGPAFLVKMRGALDGEGRLVAYEYAARSCDYNHLGYNEPDTVLIAQLMGSRRAKPAAGSFSLPSDVYAIPHRHMTGEVVSLPAVWETPLRTGNLRDPNGPQSTFPAESFIDEIAAAAKTDPLEFRLKMLMATAADDTGFRRARSIAVLKAAAEAYGWDSRPSPKQPRAKQSAGENILTGRGIAYSFRGHTIVAVVAEIEVNRQTGHVWAKRLVCAHDCGLVVNPQIPASHCGMCAAARAEPCDSRRGSVRHGESHQRRLGLTSHAPPRRHPRSHRDRSGQRRSTAGSSRSSPLWSRGGGAQTDARRHWQRHLRCDGRSDPQGPFSRCARTHGPQSQFRLTCDRSLSNGQEQAKTPTPQRRINGLQAL